MEFDAIAFENKEAGRLTVVHHIVARRLDPEIIMLFNRADFCGSLLVEM